MQAQSLIYFNIFFKLLLFNIILKSHFKVCSLEGQFFSHIIINTLVKHAMEIKKKCSHTHARSDAVNVTAAMAEVTPSSRSDFAEAVGRMETNDGPGTCLGWGLHEGIKVGWEEEEEEEEEEGEEEEEEEEEEEG